MMELYKVTRKEEYFDTIDTCQEYLYKSKAEALDRAEKMVGDMYEKEGRTYREEKNMAGSEVIKKYIYREKRYHKCDLCGASNEWNSNNNEIVVSIVKTWDE